MFTINAITVDPSYGQGISSPRILEDGKIAAAGFSNFETAFVRYLVNGSREADFDGDKKSDVSIFRPSTGVWWYQRSSNNQDFSVKFGTVSDNIVPADFTGDGKTDIAFFRPSNSTWYIVRSEEENSFYGFPFGASDDTPVVGDYDGDGEADAAVFRDSNASWYLLRSTAGFVGLQFGLSGDKPVASAFVP